MDIVYAAEKPSIAKVFGEHIKRRVEITDINVSENPDETGSFYIGFNREFFVMSPDGTIENDRPR